MPSWLLLTALLAASVAISIALRRVRPDLPIARLALTLIVAALTWRYFAWRVTSTMPDPALAIDSLYAWILVVIEGMATILLTIKLVILSRTRSRSGDADANRDWLHAQPPMLVDVFIPTYNESRDVVLPTILGARAMHGARLRIWVLDDGRRGWLRDLCIEHDVRYVTRPDNTHAKAGNLNAGLAASAAEAERASFIAVFDADFVPLPDFLVRTLALFADQSIGLVQTPQHFYTHGPLQETFQARSVWPEEQRVQYDVLLPSRDAWGTAYCGGTSWIARRDAIDAIGGIPCDSVTEDYLTSLRLSEQGWQTAYLGERLSIGLAPAGVSEYITQRVRWCIGTMQIARIAFSRASGNRLSWMQRLHLLDHVAYWGLGGPLRLLLIVILIVFWWTNLVPFHASFVDFIGYCGAAFLAQSLYFGWLSGGRQLPLVDATAQMLFVTDATRAVIHGLLRPRDQRFKVTPKALERSDAVVQKGLLIRFGGLLALLVSGMIVAVLRASPGDVIHDFVPIATIGTIMASVVLLSLCRACVEPVQSRHLARLPTKADVMLTVDAASMPATLLDLSAGGAMVSCDVALPRGSALTIRLPGVGPVRAIVVWCAGHLCGLRLDTDSAAERALMTQLFVGHLQTPPSRFTLLPVYAAMIRGWLFMRSRDEADKAARRPVGDGGPLRPVSAPPAEGSKFGSNAAAGTAIEARSAAPDNRGRP